MGLQGFQQECERENGVEHLPEGVRKDIYWLSAWQVEDGEDPGWANRKRAYREVAKRFLRAFDAGRDSARGPQ